jgi:hypothetical protein
MVYNAEKGVGGSNNGKCVPPLRRSNELSGKQLRQKQEQARLLLLVDHWMVAASASLDISDTANADLAHHCS